MSVIWIAKLVLETTAPMAITNGFNEQGFDSALARDANGLPYIPATSLVGVWRNVIRGCHGCETWFGDLGHKSKLVVTHGVLHDSRNQPVIGLKPPKELARDTILARCLTVSPLSRDRVALNDRGVAAEHAKFDQILLPAGLRFSVNIKLDDRQFSENVESEFKQLLMLLNDRRFALGSTTRNGFGRVCIQASDIKAFDLTNGPQQAQLMHEFLRSSKVPTTNALAEPYEQVMQLKYELKLQALGPWRMGNGTVLISKNSSAYNRVAKTYSEPYVTWLPDHRARLEPARPVLCGSSVKGILAHRIAFHWRRLNKEWAEYLADEKNETWERRPQALTELLGSIPGEKDTEQLQAGKLWVEDTTLEFQHTQVRVHNAVDRFTGGVRSGALFSEEVLYQPRFTLRVWLEPLANNEQSDLLLQALDATINDLRLGLLPMGAASGRGNSLVREVS